jgi:DNA-binding IclR family transcriptional regulator
MSRAVDRTLAILEFLSEQQEPVGVRETATRLQMPAAAAQRVLANLHRQGYVQRNVGAGAGKSASRKYVMTTKIIQLAERVLERMEVPQIAGAILRELRNRCDETVSLFIVDGTERVCVATEHSTQGIRRVLPVGTSLPLWAGAAGKLLLAYLPEDVQNALMERFNIQPITANTVTDRETLRRELKQIRERGWATSFGERVSEAASVAAPVFDARGVIVASVAISAPRARWTESRESTLIELAIEGAKRLSAQLGYTGGVPGAGSNLR